MSEIIFIDQKYWAKTEKVRKRCHFKGMFKPCKYLQKTTVPDSDTYTAFLFLCEVSGNSHNNLTKEY